MGQLLGQIAPEPTGTMYGMDPFDFARQSAERAMGAPGVQNPFLMNANMMQGASPIQANMIDMAAQQLAEQGLPPPEPGSLSKLMQDPNLRAMMMGAVQGTDSTKEELARLQIAKPSTPYVQIGQGGGGRQFEPTIPAMYDQAARRRGRPPLGRALMGG